MSVLCWFFLLFLNFLRDGSSLLLSICIFSLSDLIQSHEMTYLLMAPNAHLQSGLFSGLWHRATYNLWSVGLNGSTWAPSRYFTCPEALPAPFTPLLSSNLSSHLISYSKKEKKKTTTTTSMSFWPLSLHTPTHKGSASRWTMLPQLVCFSSSPLSDWLTLYHSDLRTNVTSSERLSLSCP